MNTYLGIELGSTRIKAVQINDDFIPVDSSAHDWKSCFENGVWTYDLTDAINGVKDALSAIKNKDSVKSVGISGMMHGYLAFDKDWNLLTPFRTWQNTITAEAASILTQEFNFNIPQRWSIAHLYQAVLNNEEHITKIAHITTLAGYIHFLLTGVNAVGVGEAAGIFPIDSDNLCYNKQMVKKFDRLIAPLNLPWQLSDVLPDVLVAGDNAGYLTENGAKIIDNMLRVGTQFAPPEGDASTGMVATNAIAEKTGNISAGTSIFAIIVLEKALQNIYEEIDLGTTPTGKPIAMVHCNNCTNDSNAWFSVFDETLSLFDAKYTKEELYTKLYQKSLDGDADCGGVLVCNYMAGEGITHLDSGRPLVIRRPNANFTLANFLKATLYSTMATLKLGMDILSKENVKIDSLTGHGGLFKTKGVGQKYMSAALNTPITVMETAGEGGAYGMALLAAFSNENKNEKLEDFLNNYVFNSAGKTTFVPEKDDVLGFAKYIDEYQKLLLIEKAATEIM